MPDIVQPETMPTVQRRLEGQSQGGGAPHAHVPKKVVENYQEVAKAKPFDDRITILGIPIEQITPQTQAALAGLVAEINHLRNIVKRHERAADKRTRSDAAILEPEEFMRVLGATLSQSAGAGMTWITVLVHVSTYEDIRRSSGLLAANSALDDVAQRLREMRLDTGLPLPPPEKPAAKPGPAKTPAGKGKAALPPPPVNVATTAMVPFVLLGYAGGSNLAAVTALPLDGLDADAVGRTVQDHLTSSGYVVGGIDMALAISAAATPVGEAESPLLALGRADHLLRTR